MLKTIYVDTHVYCTFVHAYITVCFLEIALSIHGIKKREIGTMLVVTTHIRYCQRQSHIRKGTTIMIQQHMLKIIVTG